MKKVYFILMGVLLSFFMVTSAMALNLKEGKWAITVSVSEVQGVDDVAGQMAQALKEMENLPPEYRAMIEEQMREQKIHIDEKGIFTTEEQCLTNTNPVPHMQEAQDDECEITQDIQDNVATFKIVCHDEDEIAASEGMIRYAYDTLEGEVQNYSLENNQKVNNSTVTISGHYVGACQK